MRNVVNNNYGNVTVEFAYSAGTGYAIAYTGCNTERLWMPAVNFPGCKSRDEAELRALHFLVNGDPRKDTYAEHGLPLYKGFTKNARVQLIGFDAFEKGIYQKHKKNEAAWNEVLRYFAAGKNGLKFDLIRINGTYSKAIYHAESYGWTALNREQNAKNFAAMVTNAKKSAKAHRAAEAKAAPAPEATVAKPAAEAKAAPGPKMTTDLQKKVERAIAMTATGIDLDDVMEAIA